MAGDGRSPNRPSAHGSSAFSPDSQWCEPHSRASLGHFAERKSRHIALAAFPKGKPEKTSQAHALRMLIQQHTRSRTARPRAQALCREYGRTPLGPASKRITFSWWFSRSLAHCPCKNPVLLALAATQNDSTHSTLVRKHSKNQSALHTQAPV